MSVRLFADHDVRGPVLTGLRFRGIDVITAFEQDAHRLEDADVLDLATQVGRALVTHDDDHLSHPFRRGALRPPNEAYSRSMIEELALLATHGTREDVANRVTFLPL